MVMWRLWSARLAPMLAVALHIVGAVLLAGSPSYEALGWGMIVTAWIGFTVYSLAMIATGDLIQKCLNCIFFGKSQLDEMGRELAMRASNFAYLLVMFGGGLVIGMHLADMWDGETEQRFARLYMELLTLMFVGAAAPTAYLGWRVRPLDAEA